MVKLIGQLQNFPSQLKQGIVGGKVLIGWPVDACKVLNRCGEDRR